MSEPEERLTDRTARAFFQRRIQELEELNAELKGTRDTLQAEKRVLRQRVLQANARLTSMGRLVRAWMAIRSAIRRPWRLPRLPLDLYRAVQRGPATSLEDDEGDDEETAAERAVRQAAERREAAAREIHQRAGQERSGSPRRLRVALIADPLLTAGLAPECDLLPVTPEDWRSRLEQEPPDLLVVQSAWHGNQGAWQYRVAWYAHPWSLSLSDLHALVDWCVARGIPTIFWDTAGPLHFERFAPAAQLFDQILTVDDGSAARYERLPRRRAASVDLLALAAQPRLHHPIGGEEPAHRPAFVGSFYRGLPLPMRERLEALLDAARERDLVIYDRALGTAPELFGFPERFAPHLGRAMPTAKLPQLYRSHRVFLAAQPGAGSAVSGRVFELLASGTPVLTSVGAGTERLFGDLVGTASDREEARRELDGLLDDDGQRRRVRREAIPLIAQRHTYAHRVADLAASVGLRASAPLTSASLSLLVLHDREAQSGPLLEALRSQRGQPAEVIIGSTDWEGAGRALQERLTGSLGGIGIRLVAQRPDEAPGERVRRLSAVAATDWVAVMDSRHRYGEHYLDGLAACIGFDVADVIGTAGASAAGGGQAIEYTPAQAVHPHAALTRRRLMLEHGWPDDPRSAEATMGSWVERGIRIFGASDQDFEPADVRPGGPAGDGIASGPPVSREPSPRPGRTADPEEVRS